MNHFALAGVNAVCVGVLAFIHWDERRNSEYATAKVTLAILLFNLASLGINVTIGLTS